MELKLRLELQILTIVTHSWARGSNDLQGIVHHILNKTYVILGCNLFLQDVVQSLVDDNLVDSDKIGTSVYFWAFPSKALAQRQSQLSQLREKLDASKSKSAELNKALENASSGREDSEDRKV